jgi:Mn-containing catalase
MINSRKWCAQEILELEEKISDFSEKLSTEMSKKVTQRNLVEKENDKRTKSFILERERAGKFMYLTILKSSLGVPETFQQRVVKEL